MDKYIGIDVHARCCTIAVVDRVGKRVSQQVVETSGASEEGMQSAWLYGILLPHRS